MNIELLGQFSQRLLTPYGSQSHLRLECRRMVPAWSFAHRLSCSAAILAAVRQKRHLSNLSKNPEPALLLLCVHRDHRLLLGQRRGNALADVGELRIAIRVAAALSGLAVGLQAELLLLQQFADNRVADPVATRRQFPRQPPQALAG